MPAMVSERAKSVWAALGFAALTVVWGTQFLVIKQGQVDLPPLMTAALRFAVVTVAAQIAVYITGARAPLGERFRRVSFGVTQALAFGLLYWAQSRLPSALAGVLSATTPLFVAVLAHRYLAAERLNSMRTAALLLGFSGISTILLGAESTSGAPQVVAVLAILAGEFASATNKVVAKQLTAAVPVPVLLRDMGFIVAMLTGVASFCFERHLAREFTRASVAAFTYLGFVASFLASGLYLVLLRRYAVTAMAYLQFATAATAAALGVVVGGERLSASLAIGVGAVLLGLFLCTKAHAQRPG
jgi:drug/metabolite transporter (DMT)-like permease